MIRVLLVLGLVACDREAREAAAPAPSSARHAVIPRPSPPPLAPVITLVEEGDDVGDDGTPDEEHTPVDDATDYEVIASRDPTDRDAIADHRPTDHQAVAVADKAPHHQAIAGDDTTTDRDVDDIPDVLDKCPDIPEDEDGSDIDGCPDPR